jgi:hypothetical protein
MGVVAVLVKLDIFAGATGAGWAGWAGKGSSDCAPTNGEPSAPTGGGLTESTEVRPPVH